MNVIDSLTVLLYYKFNFTRVDMCENMPYFMCKMPKFAVEIIISSRQDVEFPWDMTLDLHTLMLIT